MIMTKRLTQKSKSRTTEKKKKTATKSANQFLKYGPYSIFAFPQLHLTTF